MSHEFLIFIFNDPVDAFCIVGLINRNRQRERFSVNIEQRSFYSFVHLIISSASIP